MNMNEYPAGVVGLGLMGCSIATCLLMAGHRVIALAPIPADLEHAAARIRNHLNRSLDEGLISQTPEHYLGQLTITEDYSLLAPCRLVIECTIEDTAIKRSVYSRIEEHITPDALLASNTSAIPISILQKLTKHPERFFGLHWAEPSHTTRFLEVICGELSDVSRGEELYELSHNWGKEPTLVRKDIRGFITNRLMYAMYREAFHLVENGYATVEDVDRACRNNAGYWMTLVGVFRWMDLTGVPAYHTVLKDLFPTLDNSTTVPRLIDDIVKAGGKGLANGKGFYDYTPEEARLWEETFTEFTYEIRKLALKYPADVVKSKLAKQITLRQEKPEDFPAVFNVIEKAFEPLALSDHKEQFLVERLRKSSAFIPELSIVAEIGGKIVGHILLTKLKIKNGQTEFDSLALAPVSVLPEYQGNGIGGMLIEQAHENARASGHQSVVLLGHEKYYPKFGYQQADKFGIVLPFEVPKENCMAVELVEGGLKNISGTVVYPKEFEIY